MLRKLCIFPPFFFPGFFFGVLGSFVSRALFALAVLYSFLIALTPLVWLVIAILWYVGKKHPAPDAGIGYGFIMLALYNVWLGWVSGILTFLFLLHTV